MNRERGLAGPDVLTVQELAEYLRVNRKTIYEAVRRGEIPGVIRLGRALRFSRAAISAWLGQPDNPADDASNGLVSLAGAETRDRQ